MSIILMTIIMYSFIGGQLRRTEPRTEQTSFHISSRTEKMEPTKIINKVYSSCRDIREGCPSRPREMWHQGRRYWKPRGRNKMAEVRDQFDEKPRLYFRKNREAMSQATKEKTNFRKRFKFCNRTPQIVEVNIKKYLLFFDIRNTFTTIFLPNCEW